MWKVRWIAMGLVCVLLLGGCSEKIQNTSEALLYTEGKEKEPIKTVTVRKEDYVQEAFANGQLYYTKQIPILMDVEEATIESIKVKEGDKVKKGDVVATYTVSLSEADMERERLEIENERNAYNANYKSQKNAIIEMERQLKHMKAGSDKKIKTIEIKKAKEQLNQCKLSEKPIIEREKSYRDKKNSTKNTKLRSKYNGIVARIEEPESGMNVYDEEMDGEEEGMGFEFGTTIMTLRTQEDFMIEVKEYEGSLRYNSTVTVALGGDRNDIRQRLKGTVISAGNLNDDSNNSGQQDGETQSGESVFIRLSKEDRKKYDFVSNNIYIEYEKIHVKQCLVVDSKAIYKESENNYIIYFVYLVVDGNMYKRYISRALTTEELEKDEWILQGVEEGWELALDAKDA